MLFGHSPELVDSGNRPISHRDDAIALPKLERWPRHGAVVRIHVGRGPGHQREPSGGGGEPHFDRSRVGGQVREHGGVKHAVGELLTCPFCLAQWVATGFVFGYATAPRATRLAALTMTLVAGSDVLQFAYDAVQNGALGGDDGG